MKENRKSTNSRNWANQSIDSRHTGITSTNMQVIQDLQQKYQKLEYE